MRWESTRYVSRKMNLKEQSMIASFCCWVWSFIWCLLPLVGWNSYVLEGIGTSCAPNWYAQDGIELRLKWEVYLVILKISWSESNPQQGNGAKFTITFFIVVFITPLIVKIYLFAMTFSFIKVSYVQLNKSLILHYIRHLLLQHQTTKRT